MKLLGTYQSRLLSFHREELLALLQQAIAAGEYGGGKLIDSAVAQTLTAQAADFSTLPGLPAGLRATAQSILYPLALLAARYQTISKEKDDFLARMNLYLTLLEKDSGLIDQLVAAANLETWVTRQGPLSGARRFYQDFAATHGVVAADLPMTDPATGVAYVKPVQDVTFLMSAVPGEEDEPLRHGIGVPAVVRRFAPVGIRWGYVSDSDQIEDLAGPDWAKLALLEKAPRIRYGSPVPSVLLPVGGNINETFEITGQDVAGNVPVFVKTSFAPRRASITIDTEAAGVELPISNYKLIGDDFIVLDAVRSYEKGVDYIVDAFGRFVPKAATANKTLKLSFTAMFPVFSCSTTQTSWSKDTFLDGPGDGGRFLLTDEFGTPMGLWIRMLRQPATDYLIRIDTSAASDYGVSATLEVELDRPSFINGLRLAPFSNFPAYLTSITSEGLPGELPTELYDSAVLGEVIVDRPMTIRFTRQIVHKLFLTFRQENYTLTQHVVDPADQLRRNTLVALQASLPFASRRLHITPSKRIDGAQYEFGLRDLCGEDWSSEMPQDYGVLVCGPFEVEGTPELLRLNAQYSGDTKFYLIDKPFNLLGVQTGSEFHLTNPHGIEVQPGVAFSYTPPGDVPALQKCQFYLKIVMRSQYAVVERVLFEATYV